MRQRDDEAVKASPYTSLYSGAVDAIDNTLTTGDRKTSTDADKHHGPQCPLGALLTRECICINCEKNMSCAIETYCRTQYGCASVVRGCNVYTNQGDAYAEDKRQVFREGAYQAVIIHPIGKSSTTTAPDD